MKLAKKLSAITLASAMAVTSLPVTLLADELAPVENLVVEEETVEEEAPAEVETVETVDAEAVSDQSAVDAEKQKVQDAIDKVSDKVQKDYTYKAWKGLQDAVQKGQALLSATFDNGAAQKFTYTDVEGNAQSLSEEEYKKALTDESTGILKEIQDATSELETKKIKAFTEKVEAVAKLNSDDFGKIETNNATLGLSGEKSLAEIVEKAQDVLRTLLVDEEAADELFTAIGNTESADTLMKYLTDVSADANKSFKVQLTEAIAKAEDVVANKKGNYTLATYNDLKAALTTAKDKLKGTDPITAAEVSALTGKQTALVDLEPVQIELAKAAKLSNANKDYTEKSWKASADAIKAAKENVNKALTDATFSYTSGNVLNDATAVAKAAGVIKDETNAEGYVLVSIKDLKESRAKAVKSSNDADYTATSLTKYTAAVNEADLLLTKAAQLATEVSWSEVNTATQNVKKDALGLELNSVTNEWEAKGNTGLVDIKEATKLVEENKDLLTAAGQDDLIDYIYNDDWNDYVGKVNTLNTIITTNEAAATPKSVKDAVKNVTDAKAKLVKVNKNSFKEMIAKAEKEVAHKAFYADSNAKDTAFEALEKAIVEAKKVTMPTVVTVEKLNTALNTVKALPAIAKAQQLKTSISSAKAVFDAKEFMPSSKADFEANLKAAQDLIDAFETDEDKLDAAKAKLDVTEEENVKFGEYKLATKQALQAYINDAKDIPSLTYTDEAYSKLVSLINKAQAVANAGSPTAKEIGDAYEALKAAVANTANNNQALIDLYNQVKDYADYMFIPTGSEWTDFVGDTGTLAKAKEVLNSADAKAVSDAYVALKNSVEALQKVIVNKTTLKKAIDQAKDLDEYKYTVASWTKLQEAIEEAQKLVEGTKEFSSEIKTMQETTLPGAIGDLQDYSTPAAEVTALLTAGYYIADENAGNYTADSWLAYKAVRDDFADKLLDVTGASPVVDTTKAGQYTSRTETLANLEKALVNAKKALVRVSSDSLEKLIAQVEKLVEREYTAESWSAVANAVKDAKVALEDGTPSLIVNAEKVLREAMAGLVKDAAKSPAGFTKDLFNKVMGRPATDKDVEFFVNAIEKDGWTAAQLVQHFTTVPEFTNKDLSDEGFVKAIYEMGLGRTAEAAGLEYWMGELAKSDRTTVMARILASKEFSDYCATVGMKQGAVSVNPAVENFIKGLYTACLGREAATEEVLAWLPQLTNKTTSGSTVATFFINSKEFAADKKSDTEYVTALYKAFFGAVDVKGVDYWVGQITSKAKTREAVLKDFAASTQFAAMCEAAGILK